MHWDHLFDELEGQLAAEWESERAALDAESERLRVAKLDFRARLRAMQTARADARLTLISGESWDVSVDALGRDWVGVAPYDMRRTVLLPLTALVYVEVDHGTLLASAEPAQPLTPLEERMSFGFVLRDLARRRVPVTVTLRTGISMHGSIDRAGADHCDLAVHDAGEPRRLSAVQAFRVIAYEAMSWISTGPEHARR